MSKRDTITSLDTLVRVRSTEVDRLQTALAKKEATRARFQTSVERLTALAEGSGPSGQPAGAHALSPALAINCGNYKQAVFALADTHRTDLQLHEADMAVAQTNLAQAWTRRELLGKVLEQHETDYARELNRKLYKRDDEVATLSWLARQV